MFKVVCECGCSMNHTSVTFNFKDGNVQGLHLECPNCNKPIIIMGIDLNKYNILVTDKEDKQICKYALKTEVEEIEC